MQLKKLGYETRFFYGGFPSWENVGVFMSAQGFDKAYYKGSYAGLPSNAWGTEDRYFLERTKELFDASKPSFNVILTSSNHPPLYHGSSRGALQYFRLKLQSLLSTLF